MATVLGIRHGEVENPGNVIYARLPGYHLSDRGRDGAMALAHTLSGAPVGAVWASPLERALETASILARPHGLEVATDDRLLEWDFWSRWQGVPWAEVRGRAPNVFSAYAEDPGSLHPDDPLEAVGDRVLAWAREAEAGEGLVLGVSHEAPIAAAMLRSAGEDMRGFSAVHVPHLQPVRLAPTPTRLVSPQDWDNPV